MSLVATYVLATDGRYYEDPTIYDTEHWPPNWFLCFDDDDPPELVVRKGTPIPDLPYFQRTTRFRSQTGRQFDHRACNAPEQEFFVPALACFGKLTQPIPPPTMFLYSGGQRKKRSEIGEAPPAWQYTSITPPWPANLPDPRRQRRQRR
jgi:hypothetical protein